MSHYLRQSVSQAEAEVLWSHLDKGGERMTVAADVGRSWICHLMVAKGQSYEDGFEDMIGQQTHGEDDLQEEKQAGDPECRMYRYTTELRPEGFMNKVAVLGSN